MSKSFVRAVRLFYQLVAIFQTSFVIGFLMETVDHVLGLHNLISAFSMERQSIKLIISHDGEIVSSPDKVILVKDKNGNEHYVESFLFVKNKRNGKESIQEIIRIYNAEHRIPFEIMYGSFEYIIKQQNNLFRLQ